MSHVLAADYRVQDVSWWHDAVEGNRKVLTARGLRNVVLYQALDDPQRVFLTVGVDSREPLEEVLRSGVVMDWFDAAGVTDIPPIFAGDVVEKVDLRGVDVDDLPPGVVIAVMGAVSAPEKLLASVHDHADDFRASGVRQVWVYRALDDDHEVLMLNEVESRPMAEQWLKGSQATSKWMRGAGFGVYPSAFIGTLVTVLEAG